MNDFLSLSKERYSVRKFADKPVEKEKLDKIIEAAINAPTAVDAQPFKIFVISKESKEKFNSVMQMDFIKTSPEVLVVVADKSKSYNRRFDGKNFAEIDASIVATHIMLEVADLGLGTTWIGYLDQKLIEKTFPEFVGLEIIAIFPIGYPSEDCVPGPKHSMRKSKEELIEIL